MNSAGKVYKSAAGTVTVQMAITNGGEFDVQQGILSATGTQNVTTLDGSVIGTPFYNPNGLLQISGGAKLKFNAANQLYQKGSSTLAELNGTGGSTATLDGNALIEGGIVQMGGNNAPGFLNVTGYLTLAGSSQLWINVYVQSGTASSDKLTTIGAFTARGSLQQDLEELNVNTSGTVDTSRSYSFTLISANPLSLVPNGDFPGGVWEIGSFSSWSCAQSANDYIGSWTPGGMSPTKRLAIVSGETRAPVLPSANTGTLMPTIVDQVYSRLPGLAAPLVADDPGGFQEMVAQELAGLRAENPLEECVALGEPSTW